MNRVRLRRLAAAIRTRWPRVAGVLDTFRAVAGLIALMARGRRAGIVLLYHRIAPTAGDPSTELVPAVSTAAFRWQMRFLPLLFRPVSAAELPEASARRRAWQRFPIAVTFDDENPEHVEWALPILRNARVRATFFATGACLRGASATWWELLQGAVDANLPVDRLLGNGDIHARAERVKAMEPEERDQVVRALEGLGARAPGRAMTPKELVEIAGEHDVGFHTLRHDFLPALTDQGLERALEEGRGALERMLGRRLELIAYPHGGAGTREAEGARRAGYRLGFTTMGVGWLPTVDPLLIGRTEVGEERVGALARRLAGALDRAV